MISTRGSGNSCILVGMQDHFTYTSFKVSESRRNVTLFYELVHKDIPVVFGETFSFEVPLPDCYEIDQVLRALHLACGLSYYKIFLPPTVSQPYHMDESEAVFWNSVMRGGLGEFLYVNKLDPARLAQFSATDGTRHEKSQSLELRRTAMLGIGGGKDSIVAGEALRASGVSTDGFVMASGEALGQSAAVADVMNIPLHIVSRQLDTQLLQMQEENGAYKGHIPISLIFGLVGSLLALSLNASYVVVANEASASIPSAEWAGEPVNHQWSKSFAFESSLQNYLHEHVSEQLTYFSAIRPLGSVGVAKAFVKFPQYFEAFTSDNFVFRIDPAKRPNSRWSLESPKSLSSFMLLSPWISEADMLRIFGINFLNESGLKELFLSLIGLKGEPPLDCVGTPEELAASVHAIVYGQQWPNSSLLALTDLAKLAPRELDSFVSVGNSERFPAELKIKLLDVLKGFIS